MPGVLKKEIIFRPRRKAKLENIKKGLTMSEIRKIIVTGAAGFIGSHLCSQLVKQGFMVYGLDNMDDYYHRLFKEHNLKSIGDKSFEFAKADITDSPQIDQLFSQIRPHTVIHLAARAGVRPSLINPPLYERVNIRGTSIIADACVKYQAQHLVFASSSSVYGINKKVPFSEEDPLLFPISPYAVTKIAGEGLLYSNHALTGLNTTILRFFTVYGPGQRPEMAIHKFTRLIDNNKPLPFYGDGQTSRDYTFIDDIISGIMGAVSKPDGYRIFNLGGNKTVTLSRLIQIIQEKLGKEAILDKMPNQAGDVPKTYANIDKAQKILGYDPKTDIDEGIERFIKWYLEFGRTIYERIGGCL